MQSISPRAAGDPAAFAELFDRYKNLVYKTAFLMLDDRMEAEDALQEVFALVHRSLHTFDRRKAAFTTWLYRITINHCLNRRRRRRLSCLRLDELSPAPADEHATENLVEEESVRQAIHALSEKQQVVVILRYYWDLPYAEIARILDLPLGTVKSRLDLALRTLRRTLTEENQEPIAALLTEEVRR